MTGEIVQKVIRRGSRDSNQIDNRCSHHIVGCGGVATKAALENVSRTDCWKDGEPWTSGSVLIKLEMRSFLKNEIAFALKTAGLIRLIPRFLNL